MRIALRDSTLKWRSIRDGLECFFPVMCPGGDQSEELQCPPKRPPGDQGIISKVRAPPATSVSGVREGDRRDALCPARDGYHGRWVLDVLRVRVVLLLAGDGLRDSTYKHHRLEMERKQFEKAWA